MEFLEAGVSEASTPLIRAPEPSVLSGFSGDGSSCWRTKVFPGARFSRARTQISKARLVSVLPEAKHKGLERNLAI